MSKKKKIQKIANWLKEVKPSMFQKGLSAMLSAADDEAINAALAELNRHLMLEEVCLEISLDESWLKAKLPVETVSELLETLSWRVTVALVERNFGRLGCVAFAVPREKTDKSESFVKVELEKAIVRERGHDVDDVIAAALLPIRDVLQDYGLFEGSGLLVQVQIV